MSPAFLVAIMIINFATLVAGLMMGWRIRDGERWPWQKP